MDIKQGLGTLERLAYWAGFKLVKGMILLIIPLMMLITKA
jgi:hypothetical protein